MIKYQGHRYRAAAETQTSFPLANDVVDGRVVRDEVPNLGSIEATLYDYDVLTGIREVPLDVFGDALDPYNMFYAADDIHRVRELAAAIADSNEIAPLIVVVDLEGPYILEGGHRAAALFSLGARSFPAVLVIDEDEGP